MATAGVNSYGANSIPMLEAHNYKSWKFRVVNVLKGQDLWDIVNGSEQAPDPEKGTAEAKKQFKRREQSAISIIALSLSDEVANVIEDCTTSLEMWKALSTEYEPKSLARIATLRRQFCSLAYDPEESMNAFFGRVNHVVKQLADAGRPIPDDEIAFQIIDFLPESYQALVTDISDGPFRIKGEDFS